MMQPQANRERVIIRSSFASRLPEVVADLSSVRQIALNLLSNAIRYTQAGGQVIVSTAYESSGDVVMRVRDTGIGMSPGRDRAGAEAVQADQLAEADARRRHRARPAADQGDGRGQPRALHDQFDAGRRHAGRDHVPVDAGAGRLERRFRSEASRKHWLETRESVAAAHGLPTPTRHPPAIGPAKITFPSTPDHADQSAR